MNTFSRTHALTFAALVLLLPAFSAHAQTPPATPPAVTAPAAPTILPAAKTPNPNNGHGKITAISAASITVQPKGGDPKTFAITPQTKLMLDGQPTTLTAITVGLRANINSKDGATARRINAHTRKVKTAKAGKTGAKGNPFPPAVTL